MARLDRSTALLDGIRGAGARLLVVTERWVPDSWVICMILTAIALVLAMAGAGVGLQEAVLGWGSGTWNLLTLAMQFTIAMVATHACVASAPVYRALDRVAAWPDPGRPLQAVALGAAVSLVTAYLNWALCLVGCALFVPFLVVALLLHGRALSFLDACRRDVVGYTFLVALVCFVASAVAMVLIPPDL